MWILTLFIIAGIVMSGGGCNYLRTFPLYSEVYVEYPEFIQLTYHELSDYSSPELVEAHGRVLGYLKKNPATAWAVAAALKSLRIEKDMSKEQVMLILGSPDKKLVLNESMESWSYEHQREEGAKFLLALNDISSLKFQNDILVEYDRWSGLERPNYSIRKRIEKYLKQHPDLNVAQKNALIEFKVLKGMRPEQVRLVIGEPSSIGKLKDDTKVWTYRGNRGARGELSWYYGWGKLTFDDEKLVEIEVRHINIVK
jgi:outer membrane protein assembly factor BamE (lipoprotein component of BamABCDE complex)